MHHIVKSNGATECNSAAPPSTLLERIESAIADTDCYEDEEPRPSATTLRKLKAIVTEAEAFFAQLRKPKISTYFGEIDLTWETHHRMLRLIAYPGEKPMQLYVWVKDGSPLPKGTMTAATARILAVELSLVYA